MNIADANAVFAGTAAAAEVFYGANKIWPLNLGGGWRQLGETLQPSTPEGTTRNEFFGERVSIDESGHVLAVGQPGFERLSQYGRVLVYSKLNNSWISEVETEFPQPTNQNANSYGKSLALNAGGHVLAVGAPLSNLSGGISQSGVTCIFKKNGDAWSNIANIAGKTSSERFGEALSLSSNGRFLAIGAPRHNNRRGAVRVYYDSQYSEDVFSENGTILGESADDLFGASVAISSSSFFTEQYGTCVIVGAPGNTPTSSGYARIFEYGGSWVPFNQTLTGVANGDNFGAAVAIDTMSEFCAVGAPNGGGEDSYRGSVTVYERDDRAWVQKGSAIIGDPDTHSGKSISLSVTGFSYNTFRYENPQITIAIGSLNGVAVYRWNGSDWEKRGDIITGVAPLDGWGSSVSLNGAGNIVASGAPLNDTQSTNAGHARVFEYID